MKVVLLQDVKAQGKKGDVVEVSDGYARNFLFPKKMAQKADAGVLADLKAKEESRKYREECERKEAQALAERMGEMSVTIAVQAGTDGRIYGSVTAKDVADAIKEQHGIEVDKRKIEMESVKACGNYPITVKVYAGISTKMIVKVVEK